MPLEICRDELPGIRESLARLGAVIAETDLELRYVWVDNPHPAFRARDPIGKTDEDVLSPSEARSLIELKQRVLATRKPEMIAHTSQSSGGARRYSIMIYPLVERSGDVTGLISIAFDSIQGGAPHLRPLRKP